MGVGAMFGNRGMGGNMGGNMEREMSMDRRRQAGGPSGREEFDMKRMRRFWKS